jgi:hypothetical protein
VVDLNINACCCCLNVVKGGGGGFQIYSDTACEGLNSVLYGHFCETADKCTEK